MYIASLVTSLVEQLPATQWSLWITGLVAMVILVIGADLTVRSAAALAAMVGMSPAIIGATIVSLGTTAPETCVSVMAAWKGNSGLALGNAMGSVICNTGLIFGICCVLRRLPIDRFVLNRHGWIQISSGLLLAFIIFLKSLGAGGDITQVVLGRGTGILFLLLLLAYLGASAHWARRHPECIPDEARTHLPAGHRARQWARHLFFVAVGIALVVAASEALIHSTVSLCRIYGVPESIIAGTLVALGTSLPELATALTALLRGHMALSVGNIVGANILNVLFVTGAAAAVAPLQVDAGVLFLTLPAMLTVLIIFQASASLGKHHFQRWQGMLLLLCYAAYIILSIAIFGTTA